MPATKLHRCVSLLASARIRVWPCADMISSPREHVERVVWCSSRARQLSHRTASASLAVLGAWKQEGAEVAHRFLSRAGGSDAFDPATQGCNLAAVPGEQQVRLELAGTTVSCEAHGMAADMQR